MNFRTRCTSPLPGNSECLLLSLLHVLLFLVVLSINQILPDGILHFDRNLLAIPLLVGLLIFLSSSFLVELHAGWPGRFTLSSCHLDSGGTWCSGANPLALLRSINTIGTCFLLLICSTECFPRRVSWELRVVPGALFWCTPSINQCDRYFFFLLLHGMFSSQSLLGTSR